MSGLVTIHTPKPSNFDDHHPPPRDLIADCVHCGFCLPACPTHVLWGQEMDSPRGRIYMMKSVSEGSGPLDHTFQKHMDNCLGCMACMTACPSGVEYGKLLEDTRAQVERNVPRPLSERLYRRMLFQLFPNAPRLRVLAMPMLVYQRSGLQKLVRKSGLLKLLPARLRAMEDLLPPVPNSIFQKLPARARATQPRRVVGMLAGCVQQVFFQHVNQSTIRVLQAEDCEVVIPEGQPCCGALMVHCGLDEDAMRNARVHIEMFERAGVDTVVINSAGCGSTMKDYAHLLREDPVWAERAAAFSAKCKDIAEILAELAPRAPRGPLPLRVAYHDACHLRHAQNVFEQPRMLLGSVPRLEVVELQEASLCCGSAGVYNLLHPDTAAELADRKVSHLLETKASCLVSANPGCLLQLMSGLRRRGLATMPTFHMIELLDASIRRLTLEELLRERGYPPDATARAS